jgi:RimJ/RimL family protein N-acetyltransferase
VSTIAPRTFDLRGGGTLTVRSAVEADAPALLGNLAEILEGPFNVTRPGEVEPSVEEEQAWIARHRDRPGALAIVAQVEGRVVGLLDFHRGDRRRLHHRGAFGMSVLAAWRRRGIGDALVATLLDWARSEPGIEKVCLAVYADNAPAIHLYEKHGFVVEGRRLREIKLDDGTYADDLLMHRFVGG